MRGADLELGLGLIISSLLQLGGAFKLDSPRLNEPENKNKRERLEFLRAFKKYSLFWREKYKHWEIAAAPTDV
jgi:hypothetical protein